MESATPDIMSFLYQRFLEWRQPTVHAYLDAKKSGIEALPPTEPSVADFVSFARDFFIKNPPQQAAYLAFGLGVRLANGMTVAFIPQDGSGYQMRDEGIPITRPKTIPGMEGVIPSQTFPVFGNH